MVVEPESYCWSSGRLVEQRDGPTWAGELQSYSSLEYVVRDGGSGLSKGIALVRAERPTSSRSGSTGGDGRGSPVKARGPR